MYLLNKDYGYCDDVEAMTAAQLSNIQFFDRSSNRTTKIGRDYENAFFLSICFFLFKNI